jgi:hypothetical protein
MLAGSPLPGSQPEIFTENQVAGSDRAAPALTGLVHHQDTSRGAGDFSVTPKAALAGDIGARNPFRLAVGVSAPE